MFTHACTTIPHKHSWIQQPFFKQLGNGTSKNKLPAFTWIYSQHYTSATRYLDKFADKRRAPEWTISNLVCCVDLLSSSCLWMCFIVWMMLTNNEYSRPLVGNLQILHGNDQFCRETTVCCMEPLFFIVSILFVTHVAYCFDSCLDAYRI